MDLKPVNEGGIPWPPKHLGASICLSYSFSPFGHFLRTYLNFAKVKEQQARTICTLMSFYP